MFRVEWNLVGESMYRLRVQTHFNAAHRIVGYRGKWSRVHGHTWTVEVIVVGEKLDEIGMLADFRVLKEKLNEVVEKLDHTFLNDFEEIGNPTCENIARYIYERLKDSLENVRLEKVRVWEGEDNWGEYYEA